MFKNFISCVALFISVSLHAQTFTGAGGVIPDGGAQTCFPVTVSGIGAINGSFGVASVCLNINHTYDADLEIYLKAPDGTLIPLSINNGFAGVNYTNTCFTSTAATSIISGTPPYTGNFLPQGNLGAVNNGQNANGIWSLCIQDEIITDGGNLVNWSLLFNNSPAAPPVIPANDNPCNAIALTVGAGCNFTNYTNVNATPTGGVAAPGCANYAGGDVWFKVTVPAGGALIFDTQTGVILDGGMAIYSGTCNGLNLLFCNDDGSTNGAMPMIDASGLVPGSTIWIRVWEYGNDNNGTFGICVSTPPPPPTNDEPCNAVSLPVGATCNYSTFTNDGATGSAGVPAPGCGIYSGADVWFKIIVPASGSVFVNTAPGTMFDGDMAIYSGPCNALTLIQCDDFSSPTNNPMAAITLTGQTPGAVLWIRVWDNFGDNAGTFQICASLPPPPTVQDCPAAIPICQNSYFENVSYSGTGNIVNEIDAGISCLAAGERADVWYTFTVQSSGFLDFTISPNTASEDYDWAVYNLTGHTCAEIFTMPALSVSCNFSGTPGNTGPTLVNGQTSQGAGGTPYNQQIPVLAGQTYVINVSNYSVSTHGYTINFGASTAAIFDNVAPYLQSVNNSSTCGGSELAVNFSENVLCSTLQTTDFTVSGPGGPYTVTAWASASCSTGATYGNNIILTISPAITSNGAFQVCLTNASNSVTDLCGNVAPPACLNFNIAATVPVFSIATEICEGNAAPVLPTTSNNGITGTWNPAIVSNTTSATYTFTAAPGQCAVPVSLPITVSSGITPTFNSIPPVCSNGTAPVLPGISTNGINGSWNPATVSNTTSGVYTFTPLPGQCALPTTLPVTVSNAIIPLFTPVAAICAGSVAPVLPLSSNNGITGSWSPLPVSNSSSGTYTFTPAAALCATSVTLPVVVNSVVTSTTNLDICTNQLPYNWNSNTYNAAGTFNVTLVSSTGCDSIATLILVLNDVVTSTTNASICTNQLPYSWNSNSYNAAGTFDVSLVSSTGCDSIATLILVVNDVVTSTTNASICTNQLPYNWNSNTYNAAGTFNVTLVSSTGCDSIATLILVVNDVVTSTTNASICTNQLPYSWNSNTYNAAGSFDVTLLSSTGCDSIATLNLVVNDVVTSTTNASICTNQLPYSWNSNTYNAAGSFDVTLVSSTGCDSIATLNLLVNDVVTSTTNASICTNQLPYSWNGNSYNAAGSFDVTLVSSTGCDSIATLILVVNDVVTSTTNASICTNQLPYSWNSNTYNAAGSFDVTLLSSTGCDSIATLILVINDVVTSTTNASICTNQLPYNWNSNTYNAAGSFDVTLLSSTGCDSIATLILVVNDVVTSTTNASICTNQLPYNWNSNTYNAAGAFDVTLISSTGCDSIATLNLFVNDVVTSSNDITICPSQLPYVWNAITYNAAGTYNVTLVSSAGCDSIATLNLFVNNVVTSSTDITVCISQSPYSWNSNSYNAAGIYNVTLVSAAGCDSIATLNLFVNDVVTSSTDITVCTSQLPYSWNSNSYNAAGTFDVTLISSAGCDSIATLNLFVNDVVTSSTDITVCTSQLPYSWNSNTYNAAGTFDVSLVSSTGCDSIATLILVVNDVVTSSNDITICTSQLPYVWNNNSYNAAGNYNVTLVSSAGCDSIVTLNLFVNDVVTSSNDITICPSQLPYVWNANSYNAAGTYDVTLVSSVGCDSIATLNLFLNDVVTSSTDITVCTSQLPYSWNSNNYNAAGIYNVTLVSSAGCDSIATLNLFVNDVVTSSTDITVCPSQLPYSWNSNSYNAAGIYNVTLVSAAGCDSIATLNLFVNDVVTSSTDMTVCTSQLPYSWNSNNYNAAGIYNVTLVSAAGCDSIATLNLFVNDVVTSSTDITVCTSQLPYSWNSNSYNDAGIYNVTLVSAAGCDSIATLNLFVNDVVTSSTDITVCTSQLPYSWNSNSYNAAGTYNVILVSSIGCDSIATLNLFVNDVVISSTDITVCTSQLPYSWNSNSYSAAGIYNVTLVSAAGCDSIATLNLLVNDVVTSSTDITVCTSQLPYSWNSNSYNAAGTFDVTLISSAGCDSIATLNLFVNDVVTSSTDITVCTSQLPYSWNSNSYNAAGTYDVTLVSSAGCDSIATLNLLVNDVVTSSTTITVCTSQLPYSWNNNSYNAAGIYNVTLISSAGCDSIATLNLFVNDVVTSSTDITVCTSQLPYSWNSNSYNAAGNYNVTLFSSAGCDSIATLNLVVNDVVTSSNDITICPSQLPYVWNAITYNAAGTYNVTLVSSAGCDSIATLNLFVNDVVTSSTDITVCTSQLPYSWNSNSYNAAGTFDVTLISSAGCDSIATLNLFVNDVVTSSTDITVCTSQLPYSWNSNNYNAAGIYNVTLISSAGCDSIATLNLFVNDVVTSSNDITICPSQLPYVWNAITYNAAGTYNVTLVSSAGCDSIATLNLFVNDVVTSSTDITVCTSQLPYSWNSNIYNAAGTFDVTLVSSAGCDSIATLNLFVNDVVTSSTDITVCTSQLPYSWNSNSYNAAGIYNVTLVSAAGCDSIATINLVVNDVVTSSTDITVCPSQLPYSWNSNSYNAAGNYNVTLVSSSGCDSIATLVLVVSTASNSTTSFSICVNELPYTWNGNSYAAPGTYQISLTGSNGCDSVATLQLTTLQISTSFSTATICSNQLPYNWNGQGFTTGGNHSVNLINAAGCDSIASLTLVINPTTGSLFQMSTCINQLPYTWNGQNYSSTGLYNITLINSNGCDSIASLDLTVNPVPLTNSVFTTCENQLPFTWNGNAYNAAGNYSVTLSASTGCDSIANLHLTVNPVRSSITVTAICSSLLPYSWNGNNYSGAGNYTVTLTASNGCDSVATLQLAVNPTPAAPAVNSPVTYCQYQPTSPLSASITTPGSQLLWYTSPGSTGTLTAPVVSSATPGITNFYVSQVNGPCEGTRVLISITINEKPVLGPDKELKICYQQSANIAALFNTQGYIATWTNQQLPVTAPSSVNTAGLYQLIANNVTGCTDTAVVNLIIQPQVIANAGPDDNAEYNAPYQLTGSGALNYQWSPAGFLNNPFIPNPVAMLDHDETFVLMVSDEIGCLDLDTVKLRVLKGPTFYIPTAFTPNGDGLNDSFGPTAVGISKLDYFRIFNRFGELVFETSNISKGWDGTFKNTKQPVGNYVWSIKGTDRTGKLQTKRGNVALIR